MADNWVKTYPALDRMIRATLGEADENPADLRIVGRGYGCSHRGGLSLDATERVVNCSECGAKLEPFEALLNISRKPDLYRHGLDQARDAALSAKKNQDDLERLEKNAKGRAWRALSKMPAAEVIVAFAIECEAQRLEPADQELLAKRFREAVVELAGANKASE